VAAPIGPIVKPAWFPDRIRTVRIVKHVTVGEKALLVGDEVADLLIEYAALLATASRGDSVQVRAVGADGDEVVATFLLNPGVVMMAETTRSSLPEPDNTEAEAYLRERIEWIARPPAAAQETETSAIDWDHEIEGL
jgi:hypothetical protein